MSSKTKLAIAAAVVALGVGIYIVMAPTSKTAAISGSENEAPSQTKAPPVSSTTGSAVPPAKAAQPPQAEQPQSEKPKMSEYDFQKQLEAQFEKAHKEGLSAEEAQAQIEFVNVMLAGYDLTPEVKKEVMQLQQDMSDELDRANNEPQKDAIIQDYAGRLIRLIGAPQQ